MKLQFGIRTLLLCLLVVAVLCVVCDFASIELKVRSVEKAVDVDKIRHRYRELFSTVPISRLKRSHHDSVAIQAYWEQLLHRRNANELLHPNHSEFQEFLEAVERRGEVPVPNWWTEAVHSVQFDSEVTALVNQPKNFLDFAFDRDKIKTPVGCKVNKRNNIFILTVSENSVTIPRAFLLKANDGVVWSNISACVTPNRCFIVGYDDITHHVHVGCICRNEGTLTWDSYGQEFCEESSAGLQPKWATISAANNRVGLFGVWSKGIFACGFDAETGKTIYRFSSSF